VKPLLLVDRMKRDWALVFVSCGCCCDGEVGGRHGGTIRQASRGLCLRLALSLFTGKRHLNPNQSGKDGGHARKFAGGASSDDTLLYYRSATPAALFTGKQDMERDSGFRRKVEAAYSRKRVALAAFATAFCMGTSTFGRYIEKLVDQDPGRSRKDRASWKTTFFVYLLLDQVCQKSGLFGKPSNSFGSLPYALEI